MKAITTSPEQGCWLPLTSFPLAGVKLRLLTACAVIVSVFVSMASIKRKVMRNDIKNVFDSMPLRVTL